MYGKSESRVSAKEVKEAIITIYTILRSIPTRRKFKENCRKFSKILQTKVKSYTLSETDDWFDKVTVNRNMKELTNLSKQFGKIAKNQMHYNKEWVDYTKIWDHVLSRYFEIENGDSQEDEKIKGGLEEPKGHDIEEGDYKEFFQKVKKFGISSPDELDDEKKKKFFNYVDANYKGEKETD